MTKSKVLRTQHRLFALEYLANGRNATAAYRAAYPRCKTDRACEVNGSRLLRNAEVAKFVEARTAKVVEKLEYNGQRALEDIARQAQADIRKLFDPKTGGLLPIAEWPDDVADAVKTIQPTQFGYKVGLIDKLAARITIAKAEGKFTKQHEHKHILYGQLLGDGPLPEEG